MRAGGADFGSDAALFPRSTTGAEELADATSVGGRLFDLWTPGAPFMMMGVINSVVLVFAISVRLRTGKQ